MENNLEFLKLFIEESSKTILRLDEHLEDIQRIGAVVSDSLINGKKILSCGNGGSAADAQHFAAEMLVRFRSDNDRRPLPALALTQDVSTLTACANDYCFDEIYSRLIKGLGEKDDVLLAISTSGNSENILRAIEEAKKKELKVIFLTGKKFNKINQLADIVINIDDSNTARIQQAHITMIHLIMYEIEFNLSKKNFL